MKPVVLCDESTLLKNIVTNVSKRKDAKHARLAMLNDLFDAHLLDRSASEQWSVSHFLSEHSRTVLVPLYIYCGLDCREVSSTQFWQSLDAMGEFAPRWLTVGLLRQIIDEFPTERALALILAAIPTSHNRALHEAQILDEKTFMLIKASAEELPDSPLEWAYALHGIDC